MTTTDDIEAQARAYIDAALDTQRRLGQPAKISGDEYETAVSRVVRVFEDLARVWVTRRGEQA